jgi:hypothetical protein
VSQQTQAPAEIPARWWMPLDIPTYDGHPSVGHPSVVFAADGWNGYRYWMAFTPFPDDSRENPSIVASQDGVRWREPDGIRNPVVPLEEIRRAGYLYNSDPELVLTPDGWMLLYYRPFHGKGNEAIYCKRSRNGIDWSDGRLVLSNLRIRYPAGLLSPAVEVDPGGGLVMWTVNGLHLGRRVIERRTSPDGVSWSAPECCVAPRHVDPWHLDVASADGRYHMLVTDGMRLFHAQSGDGRAWTGGHGKAVGRSGTAADARGHYRSTLVPLGSVPLRWDVWVTGESGTGHNAFSDTWRIGLLHDIDLSAGAEDRAPAGLLRSWQWRWQRLRGRSFERLLVTGALLRSAIERWATGGFTFRKEGDL